MSGVLEPSVDDLSSWVGEPITEDADIKRAGQVLAYAWTLVNAETEQNVAYWRGLTKVPEPVSNVVLQVAGRGWLNPESWANERVDDWGAGGRPVTELGMYLTATEKRLLAPFARTKLRGIGVIGTAKETPEELRFRDVLDYPWYG